MRGRRCGVLDRLVRYLRRTAWLALILAGLTQLALQQPARAAQPPALAVRSSDAAAELTLRWRHPVAAAAFARAGRLWLLFDHPSAASPDLAAVAGSPFATLRHEPHPDLLVLSMELPPAPTSLSRRKSTWTLNVGGTPSIPADAVTLDATSGDLRIAAAARLVGFDDPIVGDRLGVVLLADSPRGAPLGRRLPWVEVLPSVQGVAWKLRADEAQPRLADAMVVLAAPRAPLPALRGREPEPLAPDASTDPAPPAAPEEAAVADSAQAPPHDLRASPEASEAADEMLAAPEPGPASPTTPSVAAATSLGSSATLELPAALSAPEPIGGAPTAPLRPPPPRLALAAGLVPNGVTLRDRRRALEQRVAAARGAERLDARLALARTLVAYELAAEALAVLDPLEDDADAGAVQALTGAAALLAGRAQEASRALGAPLLDGDDEVRLWRAVAAAARADWAVAAALAEPRPHLPAYPPGLRFRLGLDMARIDLHAGRIDAALAQLDRLRGHAPSPAQEAARRLVEAEALAAQGDALAAAQALTEAARDGGPLLVVAAAHTETMTALTAGRRSPTETLARLRAARPAWRGHPDEVRMLTDLGRAAVAADDLDAAVEAWRAAVRRARESEAPHAGEPARALLAGLLPEALAGTGERALRPLRALAVLRDTEPDLLPQSAARAEVERRLALRLAEAGFDAPAAELLAARADLAGSAELRARAGAALARARLAEGRPMDALTALSQSGPEEGLPEPLRRERRALEARAQQLGGAPSFLDLPLDAPGLDGEPAHRLRLERALRAGEWPAAASAAAALLGAGPDTNVAEREQWAAVLVLAAARSGGEVAATPHLEAIRSAPGRALVEMLVSPAAPVTDLAATAEGLRRLRAYLEAAALPAS